MKTETKVKRKPALTSGEVSALETSLANQMETVDSWCRRVAGAGRAGMYSEVLFALHGVEHAVMAAQREVSRALDES